MSTRTRARGTWVFPAVLGVVALAGVLAQRAVDPVGLWVFVLVLGGWVITLCLHEFAHAAVALAGGDVSVRARGYLTLNPLRYTDVANSLVIPIILLAIGGIPLPGGAVVTEPHRLRARWWASLISAAGPATNALAGVVLTLVSLQFTSVSALAAGLAYLGLLQFVAAILNLLPVPGFDGWGILAPYLPPRVLQRVRPIQPWAPLIFFAVLWTFRPLTDALFDAAHWLYGLLGGSELLAGLGSGLFRFWQSW